MGSVVKALGDAKFLVQSLAHGVSQGALSVMQGSDFLSGAAAGFLGSLGATGWSSVMGTSGGAMIAFGALAGGVGAELTGGNFWQGAITGGIVAGLNHAMHSGDDNGYDKNGKKINNNGGDTTDYKYDDNGREVSSTSVKTTFSQGGELSSSYEGYGFRHYTQGTGGGLYDPSFDIMTNVPLSGGVTLTKFGLTRLSKSAYGLSVGLGGSKTMLKSSYLFSRTPLNVSMGFRLPTIMGVSTNNLGVFLGRNSALIGAGSTTYGGYNFINKQR